MAMKYTIISFSLSISSAIILKNTIGIRVNYENY